MAAFSPSAFDGSNSEAFSESEDDFSDEDNYVATKASEEESDSTEDSEEENELFFTDQLIEQIVRETNRYARDKISSAGVLQQYSIWNDWEDVRVEEFKAFLGVIVNMALNPNQS
nr:uncharacterized protein LOC119179096 [Rhipicephalus microplus]